MQELPLPMDLDSSYSSHRREREIKKAQTSRQLRPNRQALGGKGEKTFKGRHFRTPQIQCTLLNTLVYTLEMVLPPRLTAPAVRTS